MHPEPSTALPGSPQTSEASGNATTTPVALPTIAIVGRPNVGKSTFFNRIVGGRPAIVDSQPGVTRDVHFAEGDWAGRRFFVVDTGGIVEDAVSDIDGAVRKQALAAMENADLLVFMVDGREGVHPLDQHIAELLRKKNVSVLLVVNKVDNLPDSTDHLEFFSLGLGDPFPLSATSGKGSGDLLDRVVELLPPEGVVAGSAAGLRTAVIGRPNVGKSSFINKVLGSERFVVDEVAGTTRDAIDSFYERDGRHYVFVDTAGLRRRSRVTEGLEYYAMVRTLRAIDRADVCVLVTDADQGLGNQDFRIARMAWDAGRGLVLAVNKWDLVEKDTNTVARMEREIRGRVPFLSAVPIIFISALTGQRVQRALDIAWQVGEERKKRVSTPELNTQLQLLTEAEGRARELRALPDEGFQKGLGLHG
jgi:GTP-binding protein